MATVSGVLPVAPTVFRDDEQLDLAGQRRVVDYLVDGESDGVCILANYSEQFALTDAERDQVIDATIDQAAGRIPVMVTVSHYSARIAAARARAAQERGAQLVMLMAPFFGATMRVEPAAVLEYFRRVADGLEIDIMIQDAPMSTTPLPTSLLVQLVREIPQIRYVKIEVPQAAAKLRSLIELAGDALAGPFDGEEGITLIPDLDAGATGTMSSCMVPDELGRIVRSYAAGDRRAAVEAWESVLPFIHFENRQCGLLATKILMREGGIIGSDRVRAPLAPLPEPTRSQLLELARRHDPLILRWA